MIKRADIIVKGDVQRVGYRDRAERIARKLGIRGFVENLKPYDVHIIAEGEEKDLENFIKEIEIKKPPISVEKVEVKITEPTNEFQFFEIRRGDWQEELGERLDTAGTLLYRVVELSEKSVELGEKSVALGEKSVELGEKSVALGEENLKIGKQMLEKQDKTIEEIKGMREDLKSYMERRFQQIESEIIKIKEHIGIQ